MNKKRPRSKRLKLFLTLTIIVLIVGWVIITPSNNRDWAPDQIILPYAEIENNLVHIFNIRNFKYKTTTDYEVNYYDKVFDLNKIKAVYYVVEPFSGFAGAAHTFLSFEFEDDNFIAISIEIRKEKGEEFSAIKGIFKQYEIMYVVGDERDLIKLRSNYRNDLVYVYPIKTNKNKVRLLFLDMLNKANELTVSPEFYNTITNACTISIMKHVNKISPKRIPFKIEAILPENSDKVVYELGLLDTNLSFEEARKKYLINDRAKKYADSPDFSVKIRATENTER